ncbi:hypothetical protein [Paraburkholderia sp. MM5482-R1]|uniref:hypothetical protein n=1 Tax=unclassified Paraburkholderia TaxID=2615204 RepID=UPI003D2026AC
MAESCRMDDVRASAIADIGAASVLRRQCGELLTVAASSNPLKRLDGLTQGAKRKFDQ